jgi:hypothetical protein
MAAEIDNSLRRPMVPEPGPVTGLDSQRALAITYRWFRAR